MLDINTLRLRKEPIKYTKTLKEENTCSTVNSTKKKLYNYYNCDYCGDEIRLDLKLHERSGGIVTIPHSLTKCGEIKLALCNKCVRKVQKKLEERLERITNEDRYI